MAATYTHPSYSDLKNAAGSPPAPVELPAVPIEPRAAVAVELPATPISGSRPASAWGVKAGSPAEASAWGVKAGSPAEASAWGVKAGSPAEASAWGVKAGSPAEASAWGVKAGSPAELPTVSLPFKFPRSSSPPPSYDPPSAPLQRPVTIPQINPKPAAPFALAYPPSLLSYGITSTTWTSFLITVNAFLTSKIGDQAAQHCGDMGRHIGDLPKRWSKDTAAQARNLRQDIALKSKKRDFVGAGVGVFGGIVGLPVMTALRITGAAMMLPVSMATSLALKPKTPRERATAYVAAANEKWFHERGLHADIVDSTQLGAEPFGLPVGRMADLARQQKDGGAQRQLQAMGEWIAGVDVEASGIPITLDWGRKTLWLVVTPHVSATEAGAAWEVEGADVGAG